MQLMEFQLRIRNAANSGNILVVTSVAGGTNPYIAGSPSGSGESFDPRTGETQFAEYTGEIVDADIGSMQRLVTSLLEDAGGRPQLGYRIAILEYRLDGGSWVTLINGLLTRLERTSGAMWAYAVGDPLHALTVTQLVSPASDMAVADFLTAWPARGCILGGPVIGGNGDAQGLGVLDLGGWTMRVVTGARGLGTNQYGLQALVVYGPPNWESSGSINLTPQGVPHVGEFADAINDAAATVQQNAAESTSSLPWSTIQQVYQNGYAWKGLIVLIDGVAWKPLPVFDDNEPLAGQRTKLVRNSGLYQMRIASDGVKTLTDGQIVRVRALTLLPTPVSPIFLSGHPCDLITRVLDTADIAYDSAGFDDFKETVGTDAAMTLKVTSSEQASRLVVEISKRDGIGLRGNDDGEIEPFDARLGRSTSDPIITITDADVVDGSVTPYRLDVARAIRTMIFRAKYFGAQKNLPNNPKDPSLVCGVVESDIEVPMLNPDTGAIPHGEFTLSIEGMVIAARALAGQVHEFARGVSQRLFDRYGRGAVNGDAVLIRGGAGDSVRLGDEVFVNVTQMVNHNYMLGDNPAIAARAMQIVSRTWRSTGWAVRWEDSGANRQPPSTVPTVTIAAASDLPRTRAEITVTNAATLNAASYGARLQWAFTDDGSTAAAEQFTDLIAWAPGQIPTTAFRLPAASSGTTVQVRARSELPGARATNWSAAVKIALDGVDAPTGVTATPDPDDGSLCEISWTPGSAGDLADIWLRLNGEAFSAATRVATIEPGSTVFELRDLEPGTNYIATVQHRDPDTLDVSDAAAGDVAFTTAGSRRVLARPTRVRGFSGGALNRSLLALRQSMPNFYGIAMKASEVPGLVSIEEAVEIGRDTGNYGAYVEVGRVAAAGDNQDTKWSRMAPSDRLRRKLRARQVGDGVDSSPYTPVITVRPWVYRPLVDDDSEVSLNNFKTTDSADLQHRTFSMIVGAQVERVYVFSMTRLTPPTVDPWPPSDDATGFFSVWRSGGGTLVILTPDANGLVEHTIRKPSFHQQTFIQFEPRLEDLSPGIIQRYTVDPQIPAATAQGTVSIDTDGAWEWSIDGPDVVDHYTYAEATVGFPDDAVAAVGTELAGRQVTRSGGSPLLFGETIYVTVVPWDFAGNALPSIRLRGSYQSYQPSKTTAYPATMWMSDGFGTPDFTLDANGYLQCVALNGSPPELTSLQGFPPIPAGVGVTEFELDYYHDVGMDDAGLATPGFFVVNRIEGSSSTNLGLSFGSINVGWQTLTIAVSETASTGRSYVAFTTMNGQADPGEVKIGQFYVTYAMGDPSTNI